MSYNSPYGFNTYMPFNSYGYQPQVMQEPQPQQIQQVPQIQKVTNCEWIYVNGMQQVKEHIVQPGNSRYFLDNNEPVLYEKKADNLGSCQIKAYRLSEINLNDMTVNAVQTNTTVTRDEFNALTAKINQLEQQLQIKEAIINEPINQQSYYSNDTEVARLQPATGGSEYPCKQS